MNQIILHGRLTRDPETKHTTGGTVVCNIGIAVDDYVKKEKVVYFHDAIAFGKTAENITKYFKKGTEIIISGKLCQDRWEKDGKKNQKRYIVINQFDFCGSVKSGNETKSNDTPVDEMPNIDHDPDDVPF